MKNQGIGASNNGEARVDYAYVKVEDKMVRVLCKGDLPDFAAMHTSEQEYANRLGVYEECLRLNPIVKQHSDAFYTALPFVFDHIDEVLGEERFANIPLPSHIRDSMYVSFGRTDITLGELLRVWKNQPEFRTPCPECGQESFVTSFGYSPMSGCAWPGIVCRQCGQKYFHKPFGISGNVLTKILEGYTPSSDVKPVGFGELMRHLGKPIEVGGVEYDRVCTIKGEHGVKILRTPNKEFRSVYLEPRLISVEHDVRVPTQAWSRGFATRILEQIGRFGDLPKQYWTQEFVDETAQNSDWIPHIGQLPERLRTPIVCTKALLKQQHKIRRLIPLVPQKILGEVVAKVCAELGRGRGEGEGEGFGEGFAFANEESPLAT